VFPRGWVFPIGVLGSFDKKENNFVSFHFKDNPGHLCHELEVQRREGQSKGKSRDDLRIELMSLGKEYAALFVLTHYGPCIAIPDPSPLGADPTTKWDAQGGPFQVTSSAGIRAPLTDPGRLHLALHQGEYMVALDGCGTRLSEVVPAVFAEFSGRVQAAVQELQAELQEVVVSIAVDKGPPLPAFLPTNTQGKAVLAEMRAMLLFYGWQVIQFQEALAVVHLQLCWTVEHVTPYLFCAVAFLLPVASCTRHK